METHRLERQISHYIRIYGISRRRAQDLACVGNKHRQRVLHLYHMWVLRVKRESGQTPATNPRWFSLGMEALISAQC